MTAAMAVFVLSESLHAIQSWHMKNVVMAQRNSFAAAVSGDITGGSLGNAYVLVAFLARVNGVAFLLYIAWVTHWYTALFLYLGSLLAGMVTNFILRAATGYTGIVTVAHLAVFGVPVTAIIAWWLALNG
jgi:hypothetical protein